MEPIKESSIKKKGEGEREEGKGILKKGEREREEEGKGESSYPPPRAYPLTAAITGFRVEALLRSLGLGWFVRIIPVGLFCIQQTFLESLRKRYIILDF